MSLFQEKMTASECVLMNMKSFSEYTVMTKMPNSIDGLKPIHRRILLTMHKHDDVPKEATVAGEVMKMHPHGDASIAAAISSLAQPFSNIIPLVESQSNLGTYVGDDPAAARYVDVAHAESAEDIFFRHTDSSCLRTVPCESEKGVEPANFAPTIPHALCFPVLGIACGFKTQTSAISLKNLCLAARKFIALKYGNKDNLYKQAYNLAPYFIPDFPTYCHLRNSRQIVASYRKGEWDCPFILDGIMEIDKDSITITTLPPGRSFGTVTTDIGVKTIRDKTSWFHEHFIDMSDFTGREQGCVKGKFVCQLRRGENPFDVLTRFKDEVQFTSSWRPSMLYYDNESGLGRENPLSLLDKWSDARFNVVLGGLKQKLISLKQQHHRLMALVIVVDHAKEVCDIFRNAKDEESTVKVLMERFKEYHLTAFQARYLQSLPLKRLTAKGKAELLKEIEDVKAENRALQERFKHIPEEMISDIDYFDKKYSDKYPAKCTMPDYIGTACYKKTGWIMLESVKEVNEILKRFPSEDLEFTLFQEGGKIEVLGSDDPGFDPSIDVPKYMKASYVGRIGRAVKHLSVNVKDGCSFGPKPGQPGLIQMPVLPVGERCTVIHRIEGRKLIDVDKKAVRQTINVSTPSIKDIIHVSPITDEEVFVIHCNTKVPSVVNIDRIKGDGKLSRVPIGTTMIIGVFRIGGPLMFTVPNEVVSRTTIRHFYFKDLTKFVATGETLKLLLTKRRTSKDQSIVTFGQHSQLFTIGEVK